MVILYLIVHPNQIIAYFFWCKVSDDVFAVHIRSLYKVHMIHTTHYTVHNKQYTLYQGLAIYREVTFVNVTSVAENTE